MSATSAKPLFKAISGKGAAEAPTLPIEVQDSRKPEPDVRREGDFYPTGQPEATRGLLARDWDQIMPGPIWEPAAGAGDMVRELHAAGARTVASDIEDRGCPDVEVRSFYEFERSPAPVIITNPPYAEINARDGHGRWLRHTLDMPGWRYLALLLSWDWPAAKANGLGSLLDARPFSYCYLMRWKLDFTGEGSPPQRNAWFVWRRDWVGEPAFRFMDRDDDWRQRGMLWLRW